MLVTNKEDRPKALGPYSVRPLGEGGYEIWNDVTGQRVETSIGDRSYAFRVCKHLNAEWRRANEREEDASEGRPI